MIAREACHRVRKQFSRIGKLRELTHGAESRLANQLKQAELVAPLLPPADGIPVKRLIRSEQARSETTGPSLRNGSFGRGRLPGPDIHARLSSVEPCPSGRRIHLPRSWYEPDAPAGPKIETVLWACGNGSLATCAKSCGEAARGCGRRVCYRTLAPVIRRN